MDCGNLLQSGIVETTNDVMEVHNNRGDTVSSPKMVTAPKTPMIGLDGDIEPRNGIEFDSHEAAYVFYQDYAKSMGFTTSIKNSRRSKKSKEFIDAKFACSRYGTSPESERVSCRRACVKKTDCKASMHVKRRQDGKWIIHEFIKDHNHELMPALAYHFRIHRNVKLAEKNNIDILHAVSERTRKMYVEMSRHSGGYRYIGFLHDNVNSLFDKGKHLNLEEGDAQLLLEYFKHIKKENPSFFNAIDLNEEQQLRNLFWVDGKSRADYVSFNDVVSLDTSYVKSNDKLPLVLFVGVNHHSQPMLLGCALVADESRATFVWLIKTWLRAVGGKPPKVILTDQETPMKAAIEEVLPSTRHCYHLWSILEKIPDTLADLINHHDNFSHKFEKCIFRSWTDEQFEMRWWKMVNRFGLQANEWIQSLYEDREKWVPTFLGDTFLADMSTHRRSESLNSFFDKHVHKKITLREFIKQYGLILQNRFEEESIADFDTCHKQPALKSPSPWEKQISTVYTHAVFKKFQVEILGVVGCHPKAQVEEGPVLTFKVEDCEKEQHFVVTWNESKSDVSCSCHLFEYKGLLCRHALIVLQICGYSIIPSQYILKRWSKDAKSQQSVSEGTERLHTRVQRYNDLCKRAIELSEEGSLTEETYSIVFRALMEALKNCVNVNNIAGESSSNNIHGLREIGLENQATGWNKASHKKRNTNKKRKLHEETDLLLVEPPESLHQIANLSTDAVNLSGYYGSHQNVQGLVQLNLMEPPHDAYYVHPPSIQGLGQLNAISTSHNGFFGTQQGVHGLAQLDFRTPSSFSHNLQQDVRSSQLHSTDARQT